MILKSKEGACRLSRYAGFTLVETMITVVILAILATVAYPSFMQSVRKSKRNDAYTALTRASNNLERYFGTNGAYTTDAAQLGLVIDSGTAYSDNSQYIITITAGASGIGSSYKVNANAAPGGIQADDTGCTSLSLDSLGRRSPDPTTSRCW